MGKRGRIRQMIGDKMNYYFTGILIILLCLLAWMGPAYPGSTQTNTSGSTQRLKVDIHLPQPQHINLDLVLIAQQTAQQIQI